MLICDNKIIGFIQTKGQNKPGETINETSTSLLPERVNTWPSPCYLDDGYDDDTV
jgi:hypothetical protein